MTEFKNLAYEDLEGGEEFVSGEQVVMPEDIEAYIVPAGLHAKMEFEFVEPIRPGARVRSRGRVIDKYERRGKSMSFIKPVYAGDRLTVHGVVKDKHPEGGATRVVVEVWCENQDGEKTAIGTAGGLLPA